jgi:nitric oxide reductase NorD protein
VEEKVGELWHRMVTRLADSRYPQARVELSEVERAAGILFRALGGDGGLEVTVAEATDQHARRTWLQRFAGSQKKVILAWRDDTFLRLPSAIDWFPDRVLNRDLYLWLAALAVGDDGVAGDWFVRNQRLTNRALASFPGLHRRYRRLVEAHLDLRPDPQALAPAEVGAERAVRQALTVFGSIDVLL